MSWVRKKIAADLIGTVLMRTTQYATTPKEERTEAYLSTSGART
jgi:hypothetical protein